VLATVSGRGSGAGASLRQFPRHASAAAVAPWRSLPTIPEISPQLRGDFGVPIARSVSVCSDALRELRHSPLGAEPLALAEIARVLGNHLGLARAQQQMVTRVATLGALCLFAAAVGALRIDDALTSARLQSEESSWTDARYAFRAGIYFLLSGLACCVLCLSLSPTRASIVRTFVVALLIGLLVLSVGIRTLFTNSNIVFDVAYAEPDRPLALTAIERTYFACRVAEYVGIPLVLLGRMVVSWRRPRALVAAVFTATGALSVCQSILDAALVGLLLGRVVLREHPPWLLAEIAVFSLVEMAIGIAMLSKNALPNGRALIGSIKLGVRCQCGREEVGGGGEASLAPLLGFGTLHEREPHGLVQEAGRAFVPVVASEHSLRALGPKALFGSADAEDIVVTVRGASRATLRALQVDRTTPSALHPGGAKPDATTSPPPMASAEYYVVHGRYDDPQTKLDTLAGWVSEFERAHDGRSPSLFIGGVCADLSPVELLEHMPVYIARSKRLLILAGPELPAQLWCAMECYTWFALGGRIEDVEVAIVASDAANAGAAVSAFDAFHVMYSLSGGESCTRRRLMAAVELAGIRRFNGTLRKLMPRVKDAADRQQVARLNV